MKSFLILTFILIFHSYSKAEISINVSEKGLKNIVRNVISNNFNENLIFTLTPDLFKGKIVDSKIIQDPEFRSILQKISDGIGVKNLSDLKLYLSHDVIKVYGNLDYDSIDLELISGENGVLHFAVAFKVNQVRAESGHMAICTNKKQMYCATEKESQILPSAATARSLPQPVCDEDPHKPLSECKAFKCPSNSLVRITCDRSNRLLELYDLDFGLVQKLEIPLEFSGEMKIDLNNSKLEFVSFSSNFYKIAQRAFLAWEKATLKDLKLNTECTQETQDILDAFADHTQNRCRSGQILDSNQLKTILNNSRRKAFFISYFGKILENFIKTNMASVINKALEYPLRNLKSFNSIYTEVFDYRDQMFIEAGPDANQRSGQCRVYYVCEEYLKARAGLHFNINYVMYNGGLELVFDPTFFYNDRIPPLYNDDIIVDNQPGTSPAFEEDEPADITINLDLIEVEKEIKRMLSSFFIDDMIDNRLPDKFKIYAKAIQLDSIVLRTLKKDDKKNYINSDALFVVANLKIDLFELMGLYSKIERNTNLTIKDKFFEGIRIAKAKLLSLITDPIIKVPLEIPIPFEDIYEISFHKEQITRKSIIVGKYGVEYEQVYKKHLLRNTFNQVKTNRFLFNQVQHYLNTITKVIKLTQLSKIKKNCHDETCPSFKSIVMESDSFNQLLIDSIYKPLYRKRDEFFTMMKERNFANYKSFNTNGNYIQLMFDVLSKNYAIIPNFDDRKK